VNTDFTKENKDQIVIGTHIFLDNFLGEINFATTIDTISVIGKMMLSRNLFQLKNLKPISFGVKKNL
jgi:hypothetical protein